MSPLLQSIWTKVKAIALKWGSRKVAENMSHGSSALDGIRTDLSELATLVYEYQAQFEQVYTAMKVPRTTAGTFYTTCTLVIGPKEIENVDKLIEKVKELGAVSLDLEQRAIARVSSQVTIHERLLAAKQETLARFEATNATPRQFTIVSRDIREISRNISRYISAQRATDRVGDDLEKLCADLLAILGDIREKLSKNAADFSRFLTDCREFRSDQQAKQIF